MAHAPLIDVLRACRPRDALRVQELLADEGLLTLAQVLALDQAEIAKFNHERRDALRTVRDYLGRSSSSPRARSNRPSVRKMKKKWTAREDEILIREASQYDPPEWEGELSQKFGLGAALGSSTQPISKMLPGHSRSACRHRWIAHQNSSKTSTSAKSGKSGTRWTAEEDAALLHEVEIQRALGLKKTDLWRAVKMALDIDRDAVSCRCRMRILSKQLKRESGGGSSAEDRSDNSESEPEAPGHLFPLEYLPWGNPALASSAVATSRRSPSPDDEF